MQKIILDSKSYSHYTINRFIKAIDNKSYFKRAYIDFYFPNISTNEMKSLMLFDSPDVISIVKKHIHEKELQAYLLNSFFHFDMIREALSDIMQQLYDITNLEKQNPLIFSVSILIAELMTFNPDEPFNLIVGYDFQKKIRRRICL